MHQYMQGLSPMPPTPGMDMGGMIMQGLNSYLGQKRQAAQDTKMQAMIDALKPKPPLMGNPMDITGASMMGGLGATSMPMAGASMAESGMPPIW